MADKNNNKIQSNKSNSNKPIQGAGKLLNHIHHDFGHGIKVLMVEYFKSIDDLIYQVAENSKSEKKQHLYFESLKSIRVHKLNVLSSFFNTIKQTFNLFNNKNFVYFEDKITKMPNQKNSISATFDKNDITEKLAQNSIIHKYEDKYKRHLLAFEKRFSYIISEDLEPYHIPVGPYVLVCSFAKCIRLLHLDINLKLILYNHFEFIVMSQLSELYKNINVYLNNNGIVTGLENNIITTPVKLPDLQNKISKPKNTKPLDADLLLAALSTLQNRIAEEIADDDTIALTPLEVEQALMVEIQVVNTSDESYLHQNDKDTFYLVTLLFQLIAENKNIPDTLQVILAKMQIPYLKASLLDENLIKKKQHPAQILLNLISKSAVGWSNKSDTNNIFINKLVKLVDDVLLEEKLSEDFFNQVLKDYQVFINHMKNSFASEQKRVNEKTKGKEKIVAAMTTVEALLTLKMENKTLPRPIKIILLGPWKSLLILLLVRHSNSSEKYLLMVNFIDELLNLLESTQYDVVIRTNIDKLTVEYEYGLKLVAYSGEELINKIQNFKQCLLEHHKLDENGGKSKIIPEEPSLNDIVTKIHTKISDSPPIVVQASTEETVSTQKILSKLNKQDRKLIEPIQVGTWLNFKHKNGKTIKAQLSWISPQSKKYIFVNEQGLKITDKSVQQLVQDLKNSEINFI